MASTSHRPQPAAPAAPAPLDALAARFLARVAKPRRQLALGATLLGLVVAALVARQGTPSFRLGAAALLALAISVWVFASLRAGRTWRDRQRLIRATLLQASPEHGERALRALSLVDKGAAAQQGESAELAELHFQRTLSRVPADLLERWLSRSADRARLALLAVVLAAGVFVVLDPARVLEGLDVLLSRGGHAPVAMSWLEQVHIESQPPAYLRSSEHPLIPDGVSHEPTGSMIVFQGRPEREGRHLVLMGDGREVPFVSDGTGNVVARWSLTKPVELVVAARFGDVLIHEPETLSLRAVADDPPDVELEGAPRSVLLKDLQSLELHYTARDDHGIRETALVMRAGGREERRSLERLDGEAKERRGAQALSPKDGFLRRSFLPVEVTIEARDNDAVAGAKWGSSPAITVIPPGIGEGQALRYEKFKACRTLLVEVYASVVADDAAAKDKPLPFGAAERKAIDGRVAPVLQAFREFVDTSYAGVDSPKPLRAFLLGQMRSLGRSAPTRETYLRRLEDVLLAVDAALRASGNHDAEGVAKRLGDVADEVAEGAKLGQDLEKRKAGDRRIGAAMPVLEHGADALFSLSDLGSDLGSVARGEIRRIKRGLAAMSYLEAELAARHLAARLHRPKPSFTSAGGSGGVEGGGSSGRGTPQKKGEGEASQAHRQFEELMHELEQLAQEHASGISEVESALEKADDQPSDPELEKEAKERAEALRKAFDGLPDYSPGATPSEQAGAMAREHGRAMAESLSRLGLKDAARSAESAAQELARAKQAGQQSGDVNPEGVARAEQELNKQRAWLEEVLNKARERSAEKGKGDLDRSAAREHELAERAQNISGRGSHGEAALPGDVAEALDRAESLMREAAGQLSSGHGDKALQLQREAQRLLDQDEDQQKQPDQGDQQGEEETPKDPHGDRPPTAGGPVKVPEHERNQRLEEFHKRVVEGLSRDKGGRLSPAVKRYAEGLLK